MGGSPWGTSNVMAKVVGIVKTNNSVYRDKRDNGYCARLETHIESVKVLGMVNITVLAAGSIYLGDMLEPITGTKNAEKNMNWGVPFTQRPKAVRYDYKVKMSGEKDRIRLTGFSKKGQVAGQDCAITVFFLQKRMEDAEGNITAKRGFIKSSKNFPFGAKAAFTFPRQSRIMGRNDRPVYKEDEGCSR